MRALMMLALAGSVLCVSEAEAQLPGYPAWREQFRDGACLIKRQQDRSGGYREEIACDAPSPAVQVPKIDEEYVEGTCKVSRRQNSNGASFFLRDCQSPS